jgi:hypothetical protein
MSKLKPLQVDENTVIYVEAIDEPDTTDVTIADLESSEGQQRVAKGWNSTPVAIAQHTTQTLDNTIRHYTSYTLNAFKQAAMSEVKKVTLEFGVNVSGMTGIPYIASGTAECQVKITVECDFSGSKSSNVHEPS